MRILNRADFLKLPANILYCKYTSNGNFGDLQIKTSEGEYWHPDFVCSDITGWAKGVDSGDELMEKWMRCEKGEHFQFDLDVTCRDGLYDEDQLFAVYDNDDILELIAKLKTLITPPKPPHDNP